MIQPLRYKHHCRKTSVLKHILWITLALLVSYSLQANSLMDIYKQAEQQEPNFLAAQYNLAADQQKLPQAQAALLPQVNINLNKNWPLESSMGANRRYGVTLNQPVQLDAYYNYKAIQQLDRKAQVTFEKAVQDLIFKVIDTYFKVLLQQNALESAKVELKVVNQRLDQLQRQFELGMITLATLQDSAATLKQTEVALLQNQESYDQTIDALRLLTNNKGKLAIAPLDDDYPVIPIVPSTLLEWEQLAQTNNLDLRATDLTVNQAFHSYEAKQAGRYPTLSVSADKFYTYNALGLSEKSDSAKISVSLSGSLYDAGLNRAQTIEAMKKWQASKQQRSATWRSIRQQISTLYRRIQTNIAQVNAQQQLVNAKQIALQAKEKEQQLGLRDLVDVLQAQRDVFSAQRSYASARFDYLMNSVKIRQVAGILATGDLKRLDYWLR